MGDKPDWMNPANDRKTPYTVEEIAEFVDGFILGLDEEEWEDLQLKYGEQAAREKIRSGLISLDERNLINITPDGEIH